MKCTFIGVGEAFDELQPNTSLLLQAGGTSVLLDCGFTAAPAYFRHAPAPLDLDAVHLTHFHGDHFFGLPWLLTRFMEEGRTRDLVVIGGEGVRERVESAVSLAYGSFFDKAHFALDFKTAAPGRPLSIGDCSLSFAASDHSQPCLSVRVDAGAASLFYSGDGRPTSATRALARGCGLIAHEAYALEQDVPGHGTIDGSLEFARQAGARAVALVHVQRRTRREGLLEVQDRLARVTAMQALLPEPGDVFEIPA
ncbi:MAG: MBL fold metallo-hydrolase [Desulfovibrionaceae bacterium]